MEGDADVLHLEYQIGQCLGLLEMRRQYAARIREVRSLFEQLSLVATKRPTRQYMNSCWLRKSFNRMSEQGFHKRCLQHACIA